MVCCYCSLAVLFGCCALVSSCDCKRLYYFHCNSEKNGQETIQKKRWWNTEVERLDWWNRVAALKQTIFDRLIKNGFGVVWLEILCQSECFHSCFSFIFHLFDLLQTILFTIFFSLCSFLRCEIKKRIDKRECCLEIDTPILPANGFLFKALRLCVGQRIYFFFSLFSLHVSVSSLSTHRGNLRHHFFLCVFACNFHINIYTHIFHCNMFVW